jgi:hypothetical protein
MFLLSFCIYAKVISADMKKEVYRIGLKYGVPVSVTDRLMYEESKYNDHAESDYTPEGYNSKGLFQLYTKPENIDYLVWKYWNKKETFDIYNYIHNSTVALQYLSALHKFYDSWYEALLFYNHGDIKTASEGTKAYARRIINAGNP